MLSDRHIRLRSGLLLRVAEYGDPDGLPVVYFHGGLSCRLDIRFADGPCRDAGIRLVAPDRPGIGKSEHDAARTMQGWPATVTEITDLLGIGRFAVMGWSAGGPYALACGLDLPPRLTYVATVGGMAPLHEPAHVHELGLRFDRLLFPLVKRSAWSARVMLRVVTLLPPSVLRWSLMREATSAADRAAIGLLYESCELDFVSEALRSGVEGTVHDYRLVGGRWGFELDDVGVRVDVWQGGQDRLLPMAHAERLVEALPNARLRVLPDSGHFLLRSSLETVLDEIKRQWV